MVHGDLQVRHCQIGSDVRKNCECLDIEARVVGDQHWCRVQLAGSHVECVQNDRSVVKMIQYEPVGKVGRIKISAIFCDLIEVCRQTIA